MFKIIDVIEPAWESFVLQHSESTLFHHPAWSLLIAECYGYTPFAAVYTDKSGAILAGLPIMAITSWISGKRWVSLPFSDHCAPLARDDVKLATLMNDLALHSESLKIPLVEIRYEIPEIPITILKSCYYIHRLDLASDPKELFKKFRKAGVQHRIRNAKKNGVEVTQHYNLEAVQTFYRLHLMTRKRLGVPTQPKKYFLKLWERLISTGFGFIMLARYEGKTIAGGVFLHHNRDVIYKYGATHSDYMQVSANHALLWEAIQWGYRNGFRRFDWGRTDMDNQGLRTFKRGWGTTEQILSYSSWGQKKNDYSSGWKSTLTKHMVRKSPTLVGRLLGEILYKHVG